jgi:hypothetical protein
MGLERSERSEQWEAHPVQGAPRANHRPAASWRFGMDTDPHFEIDAEVRGRRPLVHTCVQGVRKARRKPEGLGIVIFETNDLLGWNGESVGQRQGAALVGEHVEDVELFLHPARCAAVPHERKRFGIRDETRLLVESNAESDWGRELIVGKHRATPDAVNQPHVTTAPMLVCG